jgi:cytochrome d ubiquinol oxidase subunit II
VALELRADSNQKALWNKAFFIGSVIATFAQGVTLGAYISGIQTVEGMFAGGAFDWLNPFSVMVGLALISGYALLGSTYLIIKTVGEVQTRAYRQAFWAALIVAGFMILVSIWTPIHDPKIPVRWFSQPRIYFVWIFPLLGIISFILLMKSLKLRQERQPFIFSLLLFLSAYLGLQTAIFPYAIPGSITIYEAAAQSETMIFTLWGVALVIPVVLGYIIYSYWIFRGKIQAEEGYH